MARKAKAKEGFRMDESLLGQTEAHRRFREDPFSRLLMLAGLLETERAPERVRRERARRRGAQEEARGPQRQTWREDSNLEKRLSRAHPLARLDRLETYADAAEWLEWALAGVEGSSPELVSEDRIGNKAPGLLEEARERGERALESLGISKRGIESARRMAGGGWLDLTRRAWERKADDLERQIREAQGNERNLMMWHGEAAKAALEEAREKERIFEEAKERLGGFREEEARSGLEEVKRALEGVALEVSRADLGEEELEALLLKGREALESKCGIGMQRQEELEGDPQLSLALCRLAFGGARELDLAGWASERFRGGAPLCAQSDPLLDPRGEQEPALRLPEGHWGERAVYAVGDRMLGLEGLRRAWLGLSGESGREATREALLLGTSTGGERERAWEGISGFGEFERSRQEAREKGLGRGKALLGRELRAALGELGEIMGWRSPSRVFSHYEAHYGPGKGMWEGGASRRVLEMVSREASAHEQLGGLAFGLALRESLGGAAARDLAAVALARRAGLGFAGCEPSLEGLLPGLREEIGEAAGGGGEEERERWAAGEAFAKEDPMGKVAIGGLKAARRMPGEAKGVVGEAKAALKEEFGLSQAAWKALAGSERLRGLYEKELRRAGKEPARRKEATSKRVKEAMAAIDKAGDGFLGRVGAAGRDAGRRMGAQAAGRALSAAAMAGLGEAEQEGLLLLLEHSEAARRMIAGMPAAPAEDRRGDAASARERARALLEDAAALEERAGALALGLSRRLEKGRAARRERGASEAEALEGGLALAGAAASDIQDAERGLGVGFWAGMDRKDPVSHALRQHRAWEETLRARQMRENPSLGKSWGAEIGGWKAGRVEIEEISTGLGLLEEGERMSHCVASYIDRCAEGRSRIFSVRMFGQRVATLELAPEGAGEGFDAESGKGRSRIKGWAIAQNRGKHNALVESQEVIAACEAFALDYAKAFGARTQELVERERERREALEREKSERAGEKAEKAAPKGRRAKAG